MFIRFGRWRKHEKSWNSQWERWEGGVSAFRLVSDFLLPSVDYDPRTRSFVHRERWRIDLRGMSNAVTYAGRQTEATVFNLVRNTLERGAPIFLVTGRVVGKGGDGEPLLRDVQTISRLKLDDIDDNKGVINRTLGRGKSDGRILLRKRSTPRDESLYFWNGKTIMSTSKWDVADGIPPDPLYKRRE